MRVTPSNVLFGALAAALIAAALAFFLFAGGVLLQYGVKTTDFGWQAQRLGDEWYVAHVTPNGPAHGNLVLGDHIIAINGDAVSKSSTLGLMLRSVAGASLYGVKLSRNGEQREVWLRAHTRNHASFFRERSPLLGAGALFFLVGLAMLARWHSLPARLGFVASVLTAIRMGAMALLPLTGFFHPTELHIYYLFWLPVGFALPAAYHTILAFPSPTPPGLAWRATAWLLYVVWGTGALTIPWTGAIPTPVPDGVAFIHWDHVGYATSTTFFSIGFPLFLAVALAACAGRLLALFRSRPDPETQRRLKWLVTAGLLFAMPAALIEAGKWLGMEYYLTASWLSALTAICGGYALASESVLSPAMVFRSAIGAILPETLFLMLDRRYYPKSWETEVILRDAILRVENTVRPDEWKDVVEQAIQTAFRPTSLTVHEASTPGDILDIGPKSSGDPYTNREVRLVTELESRIVTVQQRLLAGPPAPTGSSERPPPETNGLLRECPKCGTCFDSNAVRCPNDDKMPVFTLPIERVVDGKYRLERLVGRGGMGAVYVGRDIRLDRRIAVKIMLSELFGHGGALRRFEREAQIAARLNHPNIIQIYDFGPVGSMGAYQIMEYVQGRSWRDELNDSGSITADTCLPWVEQLLNGIQAAHEAGIVHRDLKPDNLLLVDREQGAHLLKILDFGLAKMMLLNLSREEKLSLSLATIGTVGYVPPEQLTGGQSDERSDIYAIGRILAETLTGALPSSPLLPLDTQLTRVLNRCTAAAPDERYGSIAELRRELLPALQCVAEPRTA